MSDFTVRLVSSSHEIVPLRGTYRRERDGKALQSPVQPWDYPVTATCMYCEKKARRQDSVFADWEHSAVASTEK
jgi:hypothetical protein